MMHCKRYIHIFYTLVCGLTLCTSSIYAQEIPDTLDIDGMTTASRRLTIIKGLALNTSVDIIWKDGYSNGTLHLLKYGTSTNYVNEVNLKPFSAGRNITTTISSLSQGTKYYGQFYRTWAGKQYNLNFEFSTKNNASSIFSVKMDIKPTMSLFPIFVKDHTLFLQGNSQIDDLDILLTNGTLVKSIYNLSNTLTLPVGDLAPNAYIFRFTKQGIVLFSQPVFISR